MGPDIYLTYVLGRTWIYHTNVLEYMPYIYTWKPLNTLHDIIFKNISSTKWLLIYLFTLNLNKCNKGSRAPNTICCRCMMEPGLVAFTHLHCFLMFQLMNEPGNAAGPTLRVIANATVPSILSEIVGCEITRSSLLLLGYHTELATLPHWFHRPHWESMITGQSGI